MNRLSLNLRASIQSVLKSENFKNPSITIKSGSKGGDGYTSRTYLITAQEGDKILDLFVKSFPEDNKNPLVSMYGFLFFKERQFYEDILPIMWKFQKEKCAKEPFDNIPKYHKAENYGRIPPVILSNLTSSGYVLRDASKAIDESHLLLGLKAYAKFHAISFAMKDQKPELFESLCGEIKDFLAKHFDTIGLGDCIAMCIRGFVQSLDPVLDNNVYAISATLEEKLINFSRYIHTHKDEYMILCHGDCWFNNFMYSYEIQTGKPTDIKILDFQVVRYTSPVIDLVHYFYGCARKNVLVDFKSYMNFYYHALCEQIANLGSNPKKIYPKEVFLKHWRKFSKHGLTMAFASNRVMFLNEEEQSGIEEATDGKLPIFVTKFKHDDVFKARMLDLVNHFVDNDFL